MKRGFLLICLLVALFGTASAQNRDFSIFLAGDQSCAFMTDEVSAGWGQVLDEHFDRNVHIVNYSKAGRSTKSFINEGRWDAICTQLKKGDYVFIQFGHNDKKKYDKKRYTTYAEYRQNLKRFIADVRRKQATPVLLTPVARYFYDGETLIHTHENYPTVMREVAEEMDVVLVDLTKMTTEWLKREGRERSARFFISREVDIVGKIDEGGSRHSIEGARKISRMIIGELKRQRVKPLIYSLKER